MIERATDAAFINRVVNHPEVRPWVAGKPDGPLDMTAVVGRPENFCLVGDHGAFICFKYFPGFYEVHTQIVPEGRGGWARNFAREGAEFMFTATDCVEILTIVPEGHVAAAALTRGMGFSARFQTPPETLFRGKQVPTTVYGLTIQDWSSRADYRRDGALFHDWLNEQVLNVATGHPHDPDPDHNQTVGVALKMIENGQPAKGVAWYNRWAIAARHPTVTLLSADPIRVRFDAGILTREGGETRFDTCH